jgi:hypothetical protein
VTAGPGERTIQGLPDLIVQRHANDLTTLGSGADGGRSTVYGLRSTVIALIDRLHPFATVDRRPSTVDRRPQP